MKNMTILAALLALSSLAAAPATANGSGFDAALFQQWVDMRVGRGEPVYWYCVGTVFSWPAGKPLMRVEGIDTARLDRSLSTPTMAHQLSRKVFVYRDLASNEILTEWNGQALPPIEYPYQYITYELAGDGLTTWVEQGAAPRVQRIGPGTDILARQFGNTVAFSAPLFLDFPGRDGKRMQAFENYDFFVHPADSGVTHPYQISWLRYGDLGAGIGASVMHMVAWRIDRYEDLPASIRGYLEADGKLWRAPPRDIAEIRALQQSR
ncbi:MAG: hypothetical protein R3E65_00810 [Steroidobacteraceae bacterium]